LRRLRTAPIEDLISSNTLSRNSLQRLTNYIHLSQFWGQIIDTYLIITTSYPTDVSGKKFAGCFVKSFCQDLADSDRVIVIAPGKIRESISGNIIEYRYYDPRKPLSLLNTYNLLDIVRILRVIISGFMLTRRVLKLYPDIKHVFAMWIFPSGFFAKFATKGTKIEYSTWALGSDIWELGKNKIPRLLIKMILKDAKESFADGYKLCSDVTAISGKPTRFMASCRRLKLGNEIKIHSLNGPYSLTFLGRWHKNKGVDILLNSLKELSDDDWKLISSVTIAGGGPLAEIVMREINKLKQLGRPVEVLRYLNEIEVVKLFHKTDYLMIPSRIESIPVVFSDALQCSCPVVAMPVGDLPRIYSMAQFGVLAEGVTIEDYTVAIRKGLSVSPGSFMSARELLLEYFDQAKIVKDFIRIINE
jgi:glycosyltransferase involved in cell wall biosynthesis